ncbi:hypothetical protein [Pseudomonas sp. 7-41]|uniref:hypothetical protein n=1 Tax=Pseudomonas sp. 7-41 TaxID=2898483 RepID=UPI001E589391|nr:hypothetical protein [Pseudomonas sp. 7-41]UHG95788.1 hypothetical protein LQ249_19035 [Pseudomonas sp. 7-41]
MPNPFNLPDRLEPSVACLNKQTDDQLEKNYAQCNHNVYELSLEQAQLLYRTALGSGSAIQKNWIPGRAVEINGEPVLYIKFEGSHTHHVLPQG